MYGREGPVHAEHDELALREVDDPDDAEDQVQPDADEAVDAAEQKAYDEHVEEVGHGSPPQGGDRARRPPHSDRHLRRMSASFAPSGRRIEGEYGHHLAVLPLSDDGEGAGVLEVLVELHAETRRVGAERLVHLSPPRP